MNLKKLGLADKMIFILGIIMGSFIMMILVLGVIVAVLKMYADGQKQPVQIRSVPAPDLDPIEMQTAEMSGQEPLEAGNQQHAPADGEAEAERSIEANIMLLEADLRNGQLDTDARYEAIGKLAHAYRQAGRHREANYCLRRLDIEKTADEA